MSSRVELMYTSVSRRRAWIVSGLFLFLASNLFLLSTGVRLRDSAAITVIVFLQGLGGAIAWRRVNPAAQILELIGFGLALGTAMSVLSGLLIQVLFGFAWGWILPPLVALFFWLMRRSSRATSEHGGPFGHLGSSEYLALAAAVIIGGTSLIANIQSYPLKWDGIWGQYHPDMPFFEALATSLAKFGPFDSIFLPGAEVRYHWLVYAWSGQISEAAGAEGFVMLTRALQLVAVLASSLLVISWTTRLTRRVFTPTVAVLLLLSGGYVGVTYGGILNFDSPSQSMGVVWLLALSIALIEFVRCAEPLSRGKSHAWLLLIGVLAFATTGGKISAAAPALVGTALMAGIGIAIRADWVKRAVQGTMALFAGSLLAYLLIISGANGGGGLALGALIDRASSQQGINPTEGPIGVILGTCILVIAVGLRWTGLLWLGSSRENWRRPDIIFAFGLALAGLSAIVLFNGFNEIWFAAAASAPLAVFTAEGFESALDRLVAFGKRTPRWLVLAAILCSVVIFAIVWQIWLTGPAGGSYWRQTWRWAGPLAAILLSLVLGWFIVRCAGVSKSTRNVFAAVTIVLVLVTVPGRLLGVGSGMVGVPPGLREDLFSFGTGNVVMGNDTLLISDIPAGFMEAAAWVRDNAGPADLLATNLTFGPLVPAVTGIRTFASGIRYQVPYGRPSVEPEILRHDAEVWDLIQSPSAATIRPLCDAGVDWIWVDPSESKVRDWLPYATTAFANNDAIILKLAPEACV